jgi:hypothetical protein
MPLEDTVQTMSGSTDPTVASQLYGVFDLSPIDLFNRGVYNFAVFWAYFTLGGDEMLMRGNEGDVELAIKHALLFEGVQWTSQQARRMLPGLRL